MKRPHPHREPLKNCNKALTPEQWQFFWQNGYIKIENFLTSELFEQMSEEYERVYQDAEEKDGYGNFTDQTRAQEGDKVVNIVQVCEQNIFFRQLLYYPLMLDIVEDLIGPNIQLFHDHLIYKPAEYGGPVFWHQDNQAWQCVPTSNVSCWITLDDADVKNGALHYVRGSHRTTMGQEVDPLTGRLPNIDEIIEASPVDIVEVKAGDAIFHHCLTIHSSAENRSNRQRRTHSVIFFVTGTRCGRKPPKNNRPHDEGDHLPVSFGHPILRSYPMD